MTILDLLKSSTSQARPSIYGNYLSPRAQNEFLLCCEQDISILNQCNQSQFFSAIWLMSVLIVLIKLGSQFVFGIFTKTKLSVTEHFCGFVELQRTDAETISSSLLVNLRNWGYDLTNPRWQLNDGCSNMSCEVSGVKTRITEVKERTFVKSKLNLPAENQLCFAMLYDGD